MVKYMTCALVLICSSVAHAGDDLPVLDPHKGQKEFKEHLNRGKELYDQKNYAAAIPEFQLAFKLKQLPRLILNIGTCYRKLGDCQTAIKFYDEYVKANVDISQAEKDTVAKYRSACKASIEVVQSRARAEPASTDLRPGPGSPPPGNDAHTPADSPPPAPSASGAATPDGVPASQKTPEGAVGAAPTEVSPGKEAAKPQTPLSAEPPRTALDPAAATQPEKTAAKNLSLQLSDQRPPPPGKPKQWRLPAAGWAAIGVTGALTLAAATTTGIALKMGSDFQNSVFSAYSDFHGRQTGVAQLSLSADILCGVAGAAIIATTTGLVIARYRRAGARRSDVGSAFPDRAGTLSATRGW